MTVSIIIGAPRKDGSARVYLSVCSHSTRKKIPTNIFLFADEYSKTKKGLKIKNYEKKAQLDEMIVNINKDVASSELALDDLSMTAQDVNNLIRKKSVPLDFFVFADKWLEDCTLKGKKNYVCAINSLRAFHNADTLPFSDIDVPFLMKYQKSLEDKPRAQSAYLAVIRHLWKQAEVVYDDMLPRSPFLKFHPIKQRPKGQRATGLKVVKKIYDYSSTGRRAMLARDMFIFSLFTMGMNSVDIYNCKSYKGGLLCYDRTKTTDRRADNAHIEVRVPTFVRDILNKYRGTGDYVFKFHKEYADASAFNKALNLGLHQILGDNSPVTFYSARHTWASIARNDCKIDKYTVHEALNHLDESMKVTDLYIKKDFSNINKANKKVAEYIAEYLKG